MTFPSIGNTSVQSVEEQCTILYRIIAMGNIGNVI